MSTTKISKIVDSIRMHFRIFGVAGVIRRAIANVPGIDNQYSVSIPDSFKKICLRLGTTDVAVFEHVFIDNQYGFCLAQKPAIIIDAGANIGISSIYFTQKYPGAKIIAIEPAPENFSILKKNAELFPDIVPVNAALWNRDGFVQINDSGGGAWAMRVGEINDRHGVLVRSVTLNTLLSEYNLDLVDLLKIDVEGAECEIFEDSPNWIHRIKIISAELHDRFRPGCSEAFGVVAAGFPLRWERGELTCLAREGAISSE